MIAQLIRREPLWMVGTGVVVAALWGGLIPAEAQQPSALGMLMVFLLAAGGNRRATLFDAALPIPGPTLFTARLLFVMAAIWLPTGSAAATLLAKGQPAVAADLCASAMVLTAAAVYGMTWRIEEIDSSLMPRAGFLIAAALGMALPALWAGHAPSICAVAGLAAAGRLAMVWPKIPTGFQAAPLEPRRARVERQWGSRERSAIGVMPLVRAALPWSVLVMLAVIAFQGLLGSWVYGAVAGFGIPGTARRASRWLWGLPISRRLLFAMTVVPFLVCLAGSFAVGAGLHPLHRPRVTPVVMYDDRGAPAECWRFAHGAEAPVVRAPWGETVQPVGTRFLGWVAYNPFVVSPHSTTAFIDWQFERATEAIYGRRITTDEFRKLEPDALRRRAERWRPVVLATAVISAVAMFGVFCFTVLVWRPFVRLSKMGKTVVGTLAVVLSFGPVLGLDVAAALGNGHLGANDLVTIAALRLSAYPWLGVAIVAAAYAVLQWQFAGIEAGKQIDTIGARLIDERGIQ